VWRPVLVSGTLALSDLHDVIQTVFGWTDSHLHGSMLATLHTGSPLILTRTF
jgi:hypothetical protein